MTAQQMRYEISKTLDSIPESVLEDLMNYLKSLQQKSNEQIQLSRNFSKVLQEDRSLLEKLAK